MINVKQTIFNTLKKAFKRICLLAKDDPELLRKVLFLIVLDDIYDWSDYLDEKQSILKRLQDLRTNFILCNPEFEICRFPFKLNYVNVNTPQTGETWNRIWDLPESLIIREEITPDIPSGHEWKEDPSCTIQLVYFGGQQDKIKKNPSTGTPLLIIDNLTVCEKMNIYIDRETGIIWYLDECGTWQPTTNSGMTEDQVKQIIKDNPGIIKRTWRPNNQDAIKLEIVYDDPSANSNLELLTENDLEEMV